jgi:hypothetical protein
MHACMSSSSSSSSSQRKGRTGRVAPGVCYRLYTRALERLMPSRSEPEILRMELQQTCLQAKALVPSAAVAHTLGRALDPPSAELMQLACSRLTRLGAMEACSDMHTGGEGEGEGEGAGRRSASALGWRGEGLTHMGQRLVQVSERSGRGVGTSGGEGHTTHSLHCAACHHGKDSCVDPPS